MIDPGNLASHRPGRRWVPVLMVCMLAATGLLIANWQHPMIRLAWSPLNYLVMTLAFMLPLICAVLAWWLPRRWLRLVVSLLLLPPGLVLGFFALLAATEAYVSLIGTREGFLTETDAVRLQGSTLRAYRTNCGATCDYGLLIRQEKKIIPGVMVVRDVYSRYHTMGAYLSPVGQDSVRVTVLADGVQAPGPVLQIRPLLW